MPNEVLERISSLLLKQGKKQKQLIEYLHLHDQTYNNWKTGKSTSYLKHLVEISEYLGVSPNYLICGKDQFREPDTLESELVFLFRQFPEKKKQMVLTLVKTLAEE